MRLDAADIAKMRNEPTAYTAGVHGAGLQTHRSEAHQLEAPHPEAGRLPLATPSDGCDGNDRVQHAYAKYAKRTQFDFCLAYRFN